MIIKSLVSFVLAMALGNFTRAADVVMDLSLINQKVRKSNFRILDNALKVYQAKLEIQRARADLIPSLTLWGIGRALLDPLRLLEGIEDVAPFVVPANWFRAEEVKILFLAESEAYRALVANELYSARALYFKIRLDRVLLEKTIEAEKKLEAFLPDLNDRVRMGLAPANQLRDLQIRIGSLQKDALLLKRLIKDSSQSLSLSLGLENADHQVGSDPLDKVQLPGLLKASDFEFRVLANSPEHRQLDHFLTALPLVKKEVNYSLLGGSSISRGVAGGFFDQLPSTPQGLGFGQGARLKILDAEKDRLKLQQQAVDEVLRRQVSLLVSSYNGDFQNYQSSLRWLKLSEESLEQNLFELKVPGARPISILEVVESSRNVIQTQADVLAQQFRLLTAKDRMNRLLFAEDYEILPEGFVSEKDFR